MTIAEMLAQSGVLTLLGVGIVFGFLVVMIICVIAAGKIIHALGMDKDAAAPGVDIPSSGAKAAKSTAAAMAMTAAAITAAVNEYQKTENKNA